MAAAKPGARYGNNMVVDELAAAGARWLADDGVRPDRLIVASGAMDGVERILGAHCAPGDRIGVEDPGHPPVHQIVAALGLVAVPVQIDRQGVTRAALQGALKLGVSAVVLTPRAQNPTGAAFDSERAAELRAVLENYPRVLVIEDDHAGPVAGVPLHHLDHDRQSWVMVRSVAKTLGPDYRLAIIVGDNQTLDRVEGRMQMGAGWVSHLLQRTVASLLNDPSAAKQIALAAKTYATRRQQLIDGLAEHGIASSGQSGFQVWIPVVEEEPVIAALRDSGYAIRGASGYRIASSSAVRVTISALSETQIDEVADLLAGVLGRSGHGRSAHSRTI
jgi:DNA-binding transcriptional MocR family regulator